MRVAGSKYKQIMQESISINSLNRKGGVLSRALQGRSASNMYVPVCSHGEDIYKESSADSGFRGWIICHSENKQLDMPAP